MTGHLSVSDDDVEVIPLKQRGEKRPVGMESDSVTSKRSRQEATRAREEEDRVKFIAQPPAEKTDVLLLAAERVRMLPSFPFGSLLLVV